MALIKLWVWKISRRKLRLSYVRFFLVSISNVTEQGLVNLEYVASVAVICCYLQIILDNGS